MARQRSDAEKQVAELLVVARESLQLSLSFLTRMDGVTQHLEVIESSIPFVFKDGNTQPQETSFCQAILDGTLPAVMPNVTAFPEAMKLPSAKWPRLRSFVSVPVVLSDGTMYGTFCAAGFTADKDLTKRDKALMEVLARAAAVIIEPGVRESARFAQIEARLAPILHGDGRAVVLQPIVELATGRRIGSEALSRFPREWELPPDACFAEAHSIGQGHELEMLALARAADYLHEVTGYIAMNVSPATLLLPACRELLSQLRLDRVVLELSEHDRVDDYGALHEVLTPLRASGMQLAIDDVGAGFSSLRHIVLTRPDVIKVDRTLVDGVSRDPVLRTLVGALVAFAHGSGARVVAEGIETADDAEALLELGVDYGQGWYYGRPGPAADLRSSVVANDRAHLTN